MDHEPSVNPEIPHLSRERYTPEGEVVDGGIQWRDSRELLFRDSKLSCFSTSAPISEMVRSGQLLHEFSIADINLFFRSHHSPNFLRSSGLRS